MEHEINEELQKSLSDFKLPKYEEIPDVGLYLEQTSKYICQRIGNEGYNALTGSMISNYVKKGLISNPIKKQYSREQIAYLIFIAMAKWVLRIEDIKILIELQKQTYDNEIAYNYFVAEFENVTGYVFGMKDKMDDIGTTMSEAKVMLRNLIIALAHMEYLECYFKYYRK